VTNLLHALSLILGIQRPHFGTGCTISHEGALTEGTVHSAVWEGLADGTEFGGGDSDGDRSDNVATACIPPREPKALPRRWSAAARATSVDSGVPLSPMPGPASARAGKRKDYDGVPTARPKGARAISTAPAPTTCGTDRSIQWPQAKTTSATNALRAT